MEAHRVVRRQGYHMMARPMNVSEYGAEDADILERYYRRSNTFLRNVGELLQGLGGVTLQEMVLFIAIGVRISNKAKL
jgi:hypothetical protein